MYFPPLLPREQLETFGYLDSFPHLAGTVFSFDGSEARGGRAGSALAATHADWSGFQQMTEMVLTPAACYPLYPAVAARGPLPEGGLTLDTGDAYVFRREPRMILRGCRSSTCARSCGSPIADDDPRAGGSAWRLARRGAAARPRALSSSSTSPPTRSSAARGGCSPPPSAIRSSSGS